MLRQTEEFYEKSLQLTLMSCDKEEQRQLAIAYAAQQEKLRINGMLVQLVRELEAISIEEQESAAQAYSA